MRDMAPMTLADLDTAPFRMVQSAVLPGSPDVVFAQLSEPERWVGVFPLMTKAAWTSAQIECVGAERKVALRALGRFEERFIAWEPGKRFAFTMIASTSPLAKQMAEDYRFTREGGNTRLEWTVGAVPTLLGRAGTPALRLVTRQLFTRFLANLGRVLRERGTQVA
jgi:polyketide cyclase/dehydrase/lipid transport protein